MYYLEHILDWGYHAQLATYRSYNRSQDAVNHLTLSADSRSDSDAATIHNVIGGKTAAWGRMVYNANQTLSMVQTYYAATQTVANKLDEMYDLAKRASTGLYNTIELDSLQAQFKDLSNDIKDITEDTETYEYTLLKGDSQDVEIYIGNGYSATIISTNLIYDAQDVNLHNHATTAMNKVKQAQSHTQTYLTYLKEEITELTQQVNLADYQISQAMHYGMHIPNTTFAEQAVWEVVTEIVSDSVIALQSHQVKGQAHTISLIGTKEKPYIPTQDQHQSMSASLIVNRYRWTRNTAK